MKKIIALLLAVAMMACLFAGCNNSTNVDDTSKSTQSTDDSKTNDDTTVNGGTTDEIVELTWYQVGSGMPANYDAWKANLDAYLEEKIGVHLNVVVVGWGDWDSRRNVVVGTNEPYDIMFTNNGSYAKDVETGSFLDITDLVKTAAPDLYSYIPEDYWKACEINGRVYAVPTYKDSSLTNFFVYDEDMAIDSGADYKNAHDFESADAVVAAMYEVYQQPVTINSQGGTDVLGNLYDGLGLGLTGLGVSYYDTDAPTVVPVFEQEDAMNNLRILHSWYVKGYTNSDAAILAENPTYRPFYVAQGWPSAAKTSWGNAESAYTGELINAVAVQVGDTVLSNDTVQGSLSCISASCKYPEKALQLLELVNTDSYVRDALYYGLEGDNFDYVEVDGEQRVHKNNSDWTMAGYTQGTFFNVTQLDTDEFNQWTEVQAQNEEAIASPCLGIYIDTSSFADDLAACQAIWATYQPQIWTGVGDPDVLVPQMMAEYRDSGFDEILAEVQRQVDEWYNAQG